MKDDSYLYAPDDAYMMTLLTFLVIAICVLQVA